MLRKVSNFNRKGIQKHIFKKPLNPEMEERDDLHKGLLTIMSAQFKVLGETFVVMKRFLVLPGMIVAGTVKPGMTVSIPSFPRVLTIHSVEYLDRVDAHTSHLGLTFQYVNQHEINIWKTLNFQDQVLDIQESVT